MYRWTKRFLPLQTWSQLISDTGAVILSRWHHLVPESAQIVVLHPPHTILRFSLRPIRSQSQLSIMMSQPFFIASSDQDVLASPVGAAMSLLINSYLSRSKQNDFFVKVQASKWFWTCIAEMVHSNTSAQREHIKCNCFMAVSIEF